MPHIDMDSIKRKTETFLNSSAGKSLIRAQTGRALSGEIKFGSGSTAHTPDEAADKFVEVLRNTIAGSGLSEEAVQAVSNIARTNAISVGDNMYIIEIYFAGDNSRPSLDEERYGHIDNIVDLLNYGVDHRMNPVFGTWHGMEIQSKTVIPGAHFIEQAVADFKGNYSSEYNVLDITIKAG